MTLLDSLAGISDLLTYSAIAVYSLALVAHAADVAQRSAHRRTLARQPATVGGPPEPEAPTATRVAPAAPLSRYEAMGTSLLVLGLALNAAAVIARGVAAGRAPWSNMHEYLLVSCVLIASTYLLVLRRHPVSILGPWVCAVIVLALGLVVTTLYTPVDALIPVLDSYWLVIHVASAILAGSVFSIGAVTTVAFLVRERRERRGVAPSGSGRQLSAESLDRVAHALHVFAFPVWTFAVLAGAIWAENSWGRYWGWDPKETWAFITWVLYAAHLHAQATAGWRGRKAGYLALAGFAAFLFNFFGVNIWLPGLHSYAGV